MQIIRRLESLRRREHTATVELIEALVTCQRTRAHVDAGYATVWTLLVERLGYSPAAASRRVAAMRCVIRSPRALALLRRRRTTLSALHAVAKILLDADDPHVLLDAIDGASHAEVERVVAQARPVTRPVERVRRTVVRSAARRATGSAAELRPGPSGAASGSASEVEPSPDAAPPAEERVQLTFSLSADDFARLEETKRKLSGKYPRGITLEQLFLELMAPFEKKTAPPRRATSDAEPAAPESKPRSRHIPASTRRGVFERDANRCTFTARDGTRCTARHDLEIDHVVPWACGGTHDAKNLRVLCAAHNRRRAERTFGPRTLQRRE